MSKGPFYKPRSENGLKEMAGLPEKEFTPCNALTILRVAVSHKRKVLINCHNNRQLLANVTAFDKYGNMVLENVKEMWYEVPRNARGIPGEAIITKETFISKMFLSWVSVMSIIPTNPTAAAEE